MRWGKMSRTRHTTVFPCCNSFSSNRKSVKVKRNGLRVNRKYAGPCWNPATFRRKNPVQAMNLFMAGHDPFRVSQELSGTWQATFKASRELSVVWRATLRASPELIHGMADYVEDKP